MKHNNYEDTLTRSLFCCSGWHKLRTLLLGIVLGFIGCTPNIQSSGGATITGQVLWGDQPVRNSVIELKDLGDYETSPVILQPPTRIDGRFALENVPVGEYIIYATAPNDEYWDWTGRSVEVTGSEDIDIHHLHLSKKLQLLEPSDDFVLKTQTPMLRWQAYPGAVNYHVDVFSDKTGQAVLRQDTTQTSLKVSQPLASGATYQWSVHANNVDGTSVAYSFVWYFRVA